MTTDPRLYLDQDLASGGTIALDREDTHYLINVMRRSVGDTIRVFNGRDGEWRAAIAAASKRSAQLTLVEQTRTQSHVPDLELLFAPIKRAKTDLIIEKATELGAATIRPVTTARTQSERINVERFKVIAKEAAEQTERLDLPGIRDLVKLDRVLDGWDEARVLIFCDEAGDDGSRPWGGARGRAEAAMGQLAGLEDRPAAILIGPEGGFSPQERARLRGLAFTRPVSLGPRILRAETAAIAALTLWQSACGDWR